MVGAPQLTASLIHTLHFHAPVILDFAVPKISQCRSRIMVENGCNEDSCGEVHKDWNVKIDRKTPEFRRKRVGVLDQASLKALRDRRIDPLSDFGDCNGPHMEKERLIRPRFKRHGLEYRYSNKKIYPSLWTPSSTNPSRIQHSLIPPTARPHTLLTPTCPSECMGGQGDDG